MQQDEGLLLGLTAPGVCHKQGTVVLHQYLLDLPLALLIYNCMGHVTGKAIAHVILWFQTQHVRSQCILLNHNRQCLHVSADMTTCHSRWSNTKVVAKKHCRTSLEPINVSTEAITLVIMSYTAYQLHCSSQCDCYTNAVQQRRHHRTHSKKYLHFW